MWHYRAFKVINKHGSYYCVKEFFKFSSQLFWTKDSIAPVAETKQDLIKVLEMMLADVKKYRTKTEIITKEKR